jgi:hypothetical protein
MQPPISSEEFEPIVDRQRFLSRCGNLCRAAPPTTTFLTLTSLNYSVNALLADLAWNTEEQPRS